MSFPKIKYLMVLTLMLCCMGVFSVPALASEGGETLTVTAAWVDGELLRINVTDAEGDSSALALRLSEYVNDAENKEYIAIQAVDLAGNKSGVIEIKNPYYDPTAKSEITTPTVKPNEPPQSSVSSVPNGNKPFTPDGSGSVMDNATDGDGKEFFTIGTEDGGVFYMIVDRQRDADNVYLLNSVTLDDLVALADKSGQTINTGNNGSTSAIDTPGQPNTTEGQNGQNPPSDGSTPEPTTEPTVTPPTKSDTSMYILIGIAVVAVGGAGYYFKIVKGKKDVPNDEDEDEDEYGYDGGADEDDGDAEDGGDEE